MESRSSVGLCLEHSGISSSKRESIQITPGKPSAVNSANYGPTIKSVTRAERIHGDKERGVASCRVLRKKTEERGSSSLSVIRTPFYAQVETFRFEHHDFEVCIAHIHMYVLREV